MKKIKVDPRATPATTKIKTKRITISKWKSISLQFLYNIKYWNKFWIGFQLQCLSSLFAIIRSSRLQRETWDLVIYLRGVILKVAKSKEGVSESSPWDREDM